MANSKLENKIEQLTKVIEKLASIPPVAPVAPIAPVLPVAPVAPVAPIVTMHSGDHDTIVKLVLSVEVVEKKLDEVSKKLDEKYTTKEEHKIVEKVQIDHEERIRLLEKESEDHVLVKKVVYGAVALILVAVFSAIIYLVVSHH